MKACRPANCRPAPVSSTASTDPAQAMASSPGSDIGPAPSWTAQGVWAVTAQSKSLLLRDPPVQKEGSEPEMGEAENEKRSEPEMGEAENEKRSEPEMGEAENEKRSEPVMG